MIRRHYCYLRHAIPAFVSRSCTCTAHRCVCECTCRVLGERESTWSIAFRGNRAATKTMRLGDCFVFLIARRSAVSWCRGSGLMLTISHTFHAHRLELCCWGLEICQKLHVQLANFGGKKIVCYFVFCLSFIRMQTCRQKS